MTAKVLALCVGQTQPIGSGKRSAIDKRPVEGRVQITALGLAGDAQADRRHHGGPHMAVHHYAADHYPYWRGELPEVARLKKPGAFGENLHVSGLTEGDIFIGDRFRVGTALLEVSMGRQPCATLQRFFDRDDMIARIIVNHRCGWYYRVIEEGQSEAGDALVLVDRPQEDWSVERAFTALFDRFQKPSQAEIEGLLALPALAPQWQIKAAAKRR